MNLFKISITSFAPHQFCCTDEWSSPQTCGMSPLGCDMIGGWTLGQNGKCLNENHGIPVGAGYYTKVLMEHHWNNPTNEVNY